MRIASCLLLGLTILPIRATAQDKVEAETFFELKIRPVLLDSCFKCHGGKKVSNGFRVDSRESLVKGGEAGPAIVPGKPAESLLIKAIRHQDDELHMPPDNKLADEVIKDFENWIKDGAIWPKTVIGEWNSRERKHWAFEPVKKPRPPADATGWAERPIDQFISAKLQNNNLKPTPLADKRTLLRRVYFDLIGLPPKPEEIDFFLADTTADAYAKLVDRLLASPHYGERWGRHWMDVVRYADTAGDNADYPVPEARLYRDYIIDAFNNDKPYDQFVQEQIAGDILAKDGPKEKYAERVVATGFLALSRRYATAPYELWHLTLEDTIDTTGRAFLGLTFKCARCHDHKFDPITKEDYYALYGFFASTQFPWAGAEEFASMSFPRRDFVPLLPAREAEPAMAAHRAQIKELEAHTLRMEKEDPLAVQVREMDEQVKARNEKIKEAEAKKEDAAALKKERDSFQKQRDETAKKLRGKIDAQKKQLNVLRRPSLPADVPGAYAVQEGKPTDMYVHVRGDIGQRGPVVPRNVPRLLSGDKPLSIPEGSSGRLQLAQWLTSKDNPLTARVMVNRIWQHHFGKGIVGTPSNFGLRGESPTHPELLDWLTATFIESGWSIKAMHRLILTSKVYQMDSADVPANSGKDPSNRWYWRFDRRRLDAEAIRDALLFVSGNLKLNRPGPHLFPPIEKWGWTQHSPFKDVYPSDHRSVYLMTQRFQRHPYLAIFDGPDTNTSTDQRSVSTVPQQALYLMNSPFVQQQAESFARRLMDSSPDVKRRIELAHQLAWARPASASEIERGMRYLEEHKEATESAGTPIDRRELESWVSYARIMLCGNEFVYVD